MRRAGHWWRPPREIRREAVPRRPSLFSALRSHAMNKSTITFVRANAARVFTAFDKAHLRMTTSCIVTTHLSEPSDQDYVQLEADTVVASKFVIVASRQLQQDPYIFVKSSMRSNDRRISKFFSRSLCNTARRMGFCIEDGLEHFYSRDGRVYVVGLMKVSWSDIPRCITRQHADNGTSLLFIGRKQKISLSELDSASASPYHCEDGSGPATVPNWYSMASVVCPLGGTFVKAWGSHDDRERSIEFIYSYPETAAAIDCSFHGNGNAA